MLHEKIIEKVVPFLRGRFSVDGLTRKSSATTRTSSEKVTLHLSFIQSRHVV